MSVNPILQKCQVAGIDNLELVFYSLPGGYSAETPVSSSLIVQRKESDLPEVNKKATKKADDEAAVLAKIAAMPESYRAMGERLHALILRSAPALRPRVWYGMPGYAKDGPVICFFRADKYMTFGLTEKANFTREEDTPDQLMGSAWFFTALDDATEARLSAIVRKAAS